MLGQNALISADRFGLQPGQREVPRAREDIETIGLALNEEAEVCPEPVLAPCQTNTPDNPVSSTSAT